MPTTRANRAPSKPSASAYTLGAILKASSPLGHPQTDLHAFLLACVQDWPSYTSAEKSQIIASLPLPYRVTASADDFPLSLEFFTIDPYILRGVEKFKRDLTEGFFDPGWRKHARLAMMEREDGKFDEYLSEKVESEYGPIEDEMEEADESESDRDWEKYRAKRGGRQSKGTTLSRIGTQKSRAAARREKQLLSLQTDQ